MLTLIESRQSLPIEEVGVQVYGPGLGEMDRDLSSDIFQSQVGVDMLGS